MNARENAVKILYKIKYENAYSNIALKDNMNKELTQKDRGFVTNLVYGVISRKLTIDYIIEQFSSVKLNKISKYVLIILELGVYQIMYSDKIPDSAAVNESVKLCSKYAFRSKAFVNGILRSVVREKENIKYPNDKEMNISIKYSFPLWITKKWVDEFGEEFTKELMDSLNSNPEMIIRTNLLKITTDELIKKLKDEKIECKKISQIPSAIKVRGLDIGKSELYKLGYYTVQDIAAMLSAIVLNPKAGDRVIDLCAAPGGKTTHMAELMKNEGEIIAFDIHTHKIELINSASKRLGIDIIDSKIGDATKYNSMYSCYADKILIDVPCSGLGIIRRKPEIKWNREETDRIFDIQKTILYNGARYLKKGGELVYSTCTIDKRENEEITEQFLRENDEFERVDISDILPQNLKKETAKQGYITLYPNIDNTDGFYICKMRRRK